jgi:hypothetical protein
MTLLGSMMMPRFSEDERAVLRRIEGVLARHPYMRADLGATQGVACELQDVLSVRLGLLHTEGTSREGTAEARVLRKLGEWEAGLARAAAEQSTQQPALIRYETLRLLHPEPTSRLGKAELASRRARATTKWERERRKTPAREVLKAKLQQNRDFFRHGAMLPFYWVRRRRIRKLVPSQVLEHPALRETFFAIEQIGPLVDNFAFKGAAGLPLRTEVGLADLAFLYMQLADEFLDELAAAAGGYRAAGAIVRSVYRADTTERPLLGLRAAHLLEAGVDPDTHLTKFGISLRRLFGVLDELARVIDGLLRDASAEVVSATHLFLHHCFQTYLDEVDLCESAPEHRADRLRLQDAGWHFYRKNNMVMMLWLDLRARLLGLSPAAHAEVIRKWGYLLAAFQIFDDLKDIALDLGKQPSYPLQIAANDYPEELAWLERRFSSHRAPMTRDEVPEVNLRASNTVQQCMQWSRLIALANFDNTLLYAWDQRWKKSWTRRHRSFNPEGVGAPRRRGHVVDRLLRALLQARLRDTASPIDDAQLAFALDASAYEGSWQIYLALFPNIRAMYRFATLRMWMSAEEKARAARRLLRRYPRARANALLDLADADVDHQISRDGLEAFTKMIEV